MLRPLAPRVAACYVLSMRVDHALQLHAKGCNCAQAVLCAFAEEQGISQESALRLATGFGGGMGRTSGACGALTGAVMVLGLARGMRRPEDAAAKEPTYALVAEFIRRFRQEQGGVDCTELLGLDLGTPDGLAAARKGNLFATKCNDFIRAAVLLVEEMLGERG
jgi:C_GCAxxG_C_C family probable redox protein